MTQNPDTKENYAGELPPFTGVVSPEDLAEANKWMGEIHRKDSRFTNVHLAMLFGGYRQQGRQERLAIPDDLPEKTKTILTKLQERNQFWQDYCDRIMVDIHEKNYPITKEEEESMRHTLDNDLYDLLIALTHASVDDDTKETV